MSHQKTPSEKFYEEQRQKHLTAIVEEFGESPHRSFTEPLAETIYALGCIPDEQFIPLSCSKRDLIYMLSRLRMYLRVAG
ncbi:MAG: hypothetical protein AAFO94_20715 [Bacteroidota bacterium]